ncbi:MAG: homocysteine S-methyltransferase family protein [Saprospiraceae bacterium]|nr:homocysteine S-methyltransferase family protein [Saprospiraceae bacterium]
MLAISQLDQILSTRKYWLLDGAIGTELERRGYRTSLPLWTAFAASECPGLLQQIYREYIEAGSNILTANTFRISYYLFEREKRLDLFEDLIKTTCYLARKCMPKNHKFLLAGSIASLEDCYRPDMVPDQTTLLKYHHLQLSSLLKCDLDFILAETINTIREAHILLKLSQEMQIPIIISVVSNGKGQLLSGEKMENLITLANEFKPIGISLNCRSAAELLTDTHKLATLYPGIKGVYSNASGKPHPTRGWEAEADAAHQLGDFVQQACELDYRIFGGCCGTTPEMISTLIQTLDKSFK